MTIHLFQDKGVPLDRQRMSWKDMVGSPISKLDDDAFTRVRIILMNGVELDSLRTKQVALRMNAQARPLLAQLMRVEQHQATTINWLLGADHSPLETTIGYEQTAIEVTASVAQLEPDPYLAQGYRYALLEDFDHLYRYSALLDRLEDGSPARQTRVVEILGDVLCLRGAEGERRLTFQAGLSDGSQHPDWFHAVADQFVARATGGSSDRTNQVEAALCVAVLALAHESHRRGGQEVPLAEVTGAGRDSESPRSEAGRRAH